MSIVLESTTKPNAVEYVAARLVAILKRTSADTTRGNPATFDVTQVMLRLSGFDDRISFKQALTTHLQSSLKGREIDVRLIADNCVRVSIIEP